MRSIKQWLKREAGQSVILVALSIAMLCGVAALVVDIGMVSVREGQLQNANAYELNAIRLLEDAASHHKQTQGTPVIIDVERRLAGGVANRWPYI